MAQIADADKTALSARGEWLEHRGRVSARATWLDELSNFAKTAFERLGFPTTRDEAWRFTNVAPLTRIPFQPASAARESLSPEVVQRACRELPDCIRLVFVNGRYHADLSMPGAHPRGVILGSLAAGLEDLERVRQTLGGWADYAQHAFTALNTACFQDAAVLILPQGTVLEPPMHLLHLSLPGDRPSAWHPRLLVIADADSRATVLESYVYHEATGASAAPYFTNSVAELVLGEHARLHYCRLQNELPAAFHIGTTQVLLGRQARFDSHVLSSGGKLARHELNVVLDGEDGTCNLYGLTLARGRQLIDHQTRIEHARPACTSRELYKAVIADDARGVFSGKIHVHPGAQQTDARQTNHTLLLSDRAIMDTQPHLEIYADDVKCTHGASVGSLDEQALFYLRSRGIGVDDARRLLTFAFMNEILQRIEPAAIRSHLKRHLETVVAEFAQNLAGSARSLGDPGYQHPKGKR